ncbi:MAG: hypothetical protein R3C69_02620 [Geminicoccaceae bacterium]
MAELTARAAAAETVPDAVIAGLVRKGLATPPLTRERRPPPTRGFDRKLADILADLDADR